MIFVSRRSVCLRQSLGYPIPAPVHPFLDYQSWRVYWVRWFLEKIICDAGWRYILGVIQVFKDYSPPRNKSPSDKSLT